MSTTDKEMLQQLQTRCDSLEEKIAVLQKQMQGVLLALDPMQGTRDVRDLLEDDEQAVANHFTSGKHSGKTHEWVLANDPAWIIWCYDNGKRIVDGYTPEEIQQARAAAAKLPQIRR